MDHIVDNIDDTIPDDVVKPNDIDSREIRKMAFEKAGISQKPKKHRKKRVVFTLIAAVLAAAVLGTATAGASGSFDAVFGEYFAGESSEGLYPGGEVSIDVNSDFRAEFLGVSGDNANAVAAIAIKKADGSSFVSGEKKVFIRYFDDDDINKNGKISSVYDYIDGYDGEGEMTEQQRMASERVNVDLESPGLAGLFGRHAATGSVFEGSVSTDPVLDDNRTVKIMCGISSNDNPQGKKLDINIGPRLFVYEINETICEIPENVDFTEEKEFRKYISKLKDGQVLTDYYDYITEKQYLVIADKTLYDFELNVHVRLNYKANYKTFDISGNNTITCQTEKCTITEITAGAFGIGIKAEGRREQIKDPGKLMEQIENLPIYLTMKDGSKVKCYNHIGGGSGSDESCQFDWELVYYSKDNDNKQLLIDTDDIVSVTIGEMEFNVNQ